MRRNEVRENLLKQSMVAGNAEKEKEAVRKAQALDEPEDVATITVGCGEFLTILCCG